MSFIDDEPGNCKDPDRQHRVGEFAALHVYLAQIGLTVAQRNAAIGAVHGGRTRRRVERDLRTWIDQQPHQ